MTSESPHDDKTGNSPIPWHPAFFEAIQLELEAYRDVLEFKYEYQLTTDPLRIDTLIIKKPKHVIIEKNFAQIFRGENICEFKSPGDYLSIDDFYKVYGYACLYAAITPGVTITDLTLTFVEARYPRELIRHLTEVRGYTVDEPWPGIHRVTGDFFPIQIIESKKLSESDNIWLKGLNRGLDFSRLDHILKESRLKRKDARIRAYVHAVTQANLQILKEVTMSDYTVDDVLMEAGLIPLWLEQGRKEATLEAARAFREKGYPDSDIADALQLPLDVVANL
jgi:hypothetical protein